MASSIEICNKALVAIGQEPIMTFDGSSKTARLCQSLYRSAVDSLLRAYPWTFAIERTVLAKDQVPPPFGYMYKYRLPSDCLRIVELEGHDDNYRVEQNFILTDSENVFLRYVRAIEDPGQMDSQFLELLSLKLASDLAIPLTSDIKLQQTLQQTYDRVESQALNTQAIENAPQQAIEGNWIPSRY